MKKLSVLLLATVFVCGLVGQASAVEKVDETAFAEDQPITFEFFEDDTAILHGTEITTQFSGVEFAEGLLYKDYFFSSFIYGIGHTATNFDVVNWTGVTEGSVVTANFIPPVTRVGFQVLSPNFGQIFLRTFRDGVETGWMDFGPADGERETIFVGVEDLLGIDAIEISGGGQHYHVVGAFFIDNFRFGGTPDSGPKEIPVKTIDIDIKPPNCLPAPINIRSKGVTPVVIEGKQDFDVTMIDLDSIQLEGVAPVRSAIEDVIYCNSPEPDTFLDLTLKFDTAELVDAMGDSVTEGGSSEMFLQLTGNLIDGTPIEGVDMVSVKGKAEKGNKGKQKGKK
jgi:hypothetical protein